MFTQILVAERPFRRLVIDIGRPGQIMEHFIGSETSIVFSSDNSAATTGRIVEAWVRSVLEDTREQGYKSVHKNSRYLPDLLLKHAAEWGLQ